MPDPKLFGPAPKKLGRVRFKPMTMKHAVRVRSRVLRLRRLNTWAARRIADQIEGDLLRAMGWDH